MKNQAIILAAGKGTRMQSSLPKVLSPILGKPMIFYIIEELKKAGFTKPIIVIGNGTSSVKEKLGKNFIYVLQKQLLGSGNAVQVARPFLKNFDNILVVCGDMPLFSSSTFKNILEKHLTEKAMVTVASVKFKNPSFYQFGRIIKNKQGNFIKIVEEKEASEKEKKIKECNAGLYCFNAPWLYRNLRKIKLSPVKKEYCLTDLVQIASLSDQKVALMLVENSEEALGVNTQEQLKIIEEVLRRRGKGG